MNHLTITRLITALGLLLTLPFAFALEPKQRVYSGSYGAHTLKGEAVFSRDGDTFSNKLGMHTKVLFKDIELSFASNGTIKNGAVSLSSLREVRANGSVTVLNLNHKDKKITAEQNNNAYDYHADTVDLLSLIAQLGQWVSSKPEWQKVGAAHTFHVLRPAGLREWRYQAVALETLTIGGKAVDAVHVKRVAEAGEQDTVHHMWLAPKEGGLLLKLRLEDPKNASQSPEITLQSL